MFFTTIAEARKYLKLHPLPELHHVVKCNKLTLSDPVPGYTVVMR